MIDEIRLNRQTSAAFKRRLQQARGYFADDESSLDNVARIADKLEYANMSYSIQQAKRATADTLKRLELMQKEYEIYEKAIEEFDFASAKLLRNIPQIDTEDIKDMWFVDSEKINIALLNSILMGNSNVGIRTIFESRSDVDKVDWERTENGKSKITVTFNNGDPAVVLLEGEDYYIAEDGKSYFYNNVRAMLEAAGTTVDYQQTPGGGSTIGISLGGMLLKTLVEGEDYEIGVDEKAHFMDEAHGPLPPGANPNNEQMRRLIEVALGEVGYHEKNKDGKEGSGNYTKYGDWYNSDGKKWCAMFVSWCANEIGLSTDVMLKFAAVDEGRQWYKDEERYFLRDSEYEPKEGDTIFFKNQKSGQNHVGLVTAYDAENKTVYTVEGNTSDMVGLKQYKMSDTYITGFGSNGGDSFGTIPTGSSDGSGAKID